MGRRAICDFKVLELLPRGYLGVVPGRWKFKESGGACHCRIEIYVDQACSVVAQGCLHITCAPCMMACVAFASAPRSPGPESRPQQHRLLFYASQDGTGGGNEHPALTVQGKVLI